jgi:hypothetical protein
MADRLVKVLGLAEKVHVDGNKEYIDFHAPMLRLTNNTLKCHLFLLFWGILLGWGYR